MRRRRSSGDDGDGLGLEFDGRYRRGYIDNYRDDGDQRRLDDDGRDHGFGFELERGSHRKIEHFGHVQIDDDVEIGANSTIDRGRFGRTWIGEGTKIDNLVMVAHNCRLGKHTVMAAQSDLVDVVQCELAIRKLFCAG